MDTKQLELESDVVLYTVHCYYSSNKRVTVTVFEPKDGDEKRDTCDLISRLQYETPMEKTSNKKDSLIIHRKKYIYICSGFIILKLV